ncbi:MAG: LysR family transcriptional regulator [Clostridia bacterium]|nr:LysR family transcriptional regulator [Clostridia bacterium]
MEIRFVREFLSLVETESYFETAEQLFITTSSLSRHIKALESEIGVTLFDRTTRRVTLNRHGRLFLPYAKELVRIDEECTQAFAADLHDHNARISIGSIPMMRAYRITDLLAEYQYGNKTTELNIEEGDPFNLLPMIREGTLDFAFIRDPGNLTDDIERLPFTEDSLCVIVPADHPFAGRQSLSISDLKDKPLLMIGKDAFMYRLCINLCHADGFEPNVRFTSHRAENLIHGVEHGMGLAMLMQKAAALQITDKCRMIRITPEVKTQIMLVWLRDRSLPLHHKRFIELARGLDC